MKRHKLNFTLALAILSSYLNAQDSIVKKDVLTERKHEIGVSILTPLIMLTGASDSHNERFTYITYRRWLTTRSAIKGALGFAPFYQEYNPYPAGAVSSPQNTVYLNVTPTNPTNYQICFGYEKMFGGKLKQVIGIDLLYNNRFVVEQYYYTEAYEQTGPNGDKHTLYRNLDTGAYRSYRKTYNYHKFGFNVSYSLRYEMSRRLAMTASVIGSFKYYEVKQNKGYASNFDFNMPGLIADVSLFYRFN